LHAKQRHAPPFIAKVLMATPKMTLNPGKLLLSKWTAVDPRRKEKHFLGTRVVKPDSPAAPIEFVEIEAVHSRRTRILSWRDLADPGVWQQGWK
jgi:tryptophan-rich hypothetical protein